jgi:protein TonB
MKRTLVAACLLLGLSIPALAQSGAAKPDDNVKTADNAAPHKVDSKTAIGYKIHDVPPWYPPLAQRAKIQGDVVLHAIIDTTGKVTQLRVLSGHPILAKSALDAVRQWKYRPYLLDGKAVPVDTTITVSFHL